MLPLLIPAVIAIGVGLVVDKKVNDKIDDSIFRGSLEAEYKIRKKINRTIHRGIIEIVFNIFILLLTYFLINLSFLRNFQMGILSSVIYIPMFRTLLLMNQHWKSICSFIFKFKLKLPAFLFHKVYSEVYPEAYKKVLKEINQLGFFESIFFSAFGNKNITSISKDITTKGIQLAWKNIFYNSVILIVIIALYSLVFRIILFPYVLDTHLGISMYDILLYPIIAGWEWVNAFYILVIEIF